MSFFGRFKPEFWDHDLDEKGRSSLINFRKVWKYTVLLIAGIAIVSLLVMSFVGYSLTHEAVESSVLLRATNFTANTWRTVSFFLTERMLALDFIVQDNTYEELRDPAHLQMIRENLRKELGGFTDLGVIDASGLQHTYVGPYDLEGKVYAGQKWFENVLESGLFVSEVFLGFRNAPHIVLAVKKGLDEGSFYVLRATLDMERFFKILSQLEIGGRGDIFIINGEGIIQTPSRYHGDVLKKTDLAIPDYSERVRASRAADARGEPIVLASKYIPDTPFILLVVQQMNEVMKDWFAVQLEFIVFLVIGITLVLGVTLGTATYLVNRIYTADKHRIMAQHRVEYSSKMAALGRLSAGVAHEINNPLAIINEKAGLIKDLFTFDKNYKRDPKLIGLVDSILYSVARCGTITKRLLSFARSSDERLQPVNLHEVVHDVLGFLAKESEYRSIEVTTDIPLEGSTIESNKSKLQQIFLNLINNAFAAMRDGGRLEVRMTPLDGDRVSVAVSDTGCGMSKKVKDQIFEPFFSTKTSEGGTGLGLSITYNLIRELGGEIEVESEEGRGSVFVVVLPVRGKREEKKNDESTAG